jgi:multicomponent Na+:H+ antiporter subunit B
VSDSLILRTAVRFLVPLLGLLSLFFLLRGHNEPGGGFIGGLVAAGAVALVKLAEGGDVARRVIRVDPRTLLVFGLAAVVGAAVTGLAVGRQVLSGVWLKTPIPGIGKVGSVLVFDVGVFLIVVATVVLMVVELADERPT